MAIRKLQRVFAPGSELLTLDSAIRSALSKAMRACPQKTREAIAAELSEQTGTRVTLHMLNEFTAESRRQYRFPAAWVVPFCRITGDDSLQRLLLGPELAEVLRIGESEVANHHLKSQLIDRLSRMSSVNSNSIIEVTRMDSCFTDSSSKVQGK